MEKKTEDVGAVIVAAGLSSRMGDFKPMLTMGTISVSQRIIATLKHAGVNRIVVVTGYRADELEHHLARSGVLFFRNENFRTTDMFHSATIGLKYLSQSCRRILFTPVDIPLFTAATVKRLLETEGDYICPVCGGDTGHPVLMSDRLVEKIIADSGEGGLKGALARSGFPMVPVPVEDYGILKDMDTKEDYAELLAYHNSQLIRPLITLQLAREKPFFDERAALLLSLIDETRSVSKACKRMQLSYSSGWNTIRSIEEQLGYSLVERTQGGSGGSSSHLTERGKAFLNIYTEYQANVNRMARSLFEYYLRLWEEFDETKDAGSSEAFS